MEMKEVTKKDDWDSFLLTLGATFPQSWDWGEVLLSEGKKVRRLALVEGEEILAMAQIMEARLPLGLKYGFCPNGPVLKRGLAKDIRVRIYELLQNWARNAGYIFLRIEPELVPGAVTMKKVRDVNPSTTLVLELIGSQEKYLENLDKKTRYEINQANKRGVSVVVGKNLGIFWSLLKEVSRHDDFLTHPQIHYEKIVERPGTHDLVACPWRYRLYNFQRWLRSLI